MRIIIIGGGLIGLASAQALIERGHDVLVLEAREDVGLETSYANGGMLTPSLPEPWNGPGVLTHLLQSLFDPRAALKLRPRVLPSLVGWGIAFLRNSRESRYLAATEDNYRLAVFSLARTLDVSRRLALNYDLAERGTLCLFEDRANLENRRQVCELLAPLGLRFEDYTPAAVVAAEPLLAPIRDRLVGGIWLPDDARGDAHRFCQALAVAIREQGGEIRTGTRVQALVRVKGRVAAVLTGDGEVAADRIVVAAGVDSSLLLRGVGVRVAVQPAKGYSITIDAGDLGPLPSAAIADDASHAVVTTFGTRLRVVGTAEFAGFDKRLTPARIDNLHRILAHLLPRLAARISPADDQPWAGLRPLSADGRPYIGPTSIPGLFVNTGHGALGWTLAMGSGHLLAGLLDGTPTAVDPTPFLPCRHA